MFICIFNRKIHFDCDYSEAIIKKVAALSRQFTKTRVMLSRMRQHDTSSHNLHRLVLCIYFNAHFFCA